MVWLIFISVVTAIFAAIAGRSPREGGVAITRRARNGGWQLSESGNETRVLRNHRITVFESDGGWKFCIADATEDDDEPHFSEAYNTKDQAAHEALAMMGEVGSRYRSPREIAREQREVRTDRHHRDEMENAEAVVCDLEEVAYAAIADAEVNITKLRPIERRLKQQYRRMRDAYIHFADVPRKNALAESLMDRMAAAQSAVQDKIGWLKTTPKGRRKVT